MKAHSRFDCHHQQEGLRNLPRRGTTAAHPGAGAVLHTWAGLRPLTPDGRPIVGRDPEIEHLWYATGHGRNGVLLAALTGEVIGDLLSTGKTSVDVLGWQPGRLRAAEA
jgi:glycine oxidase